MMLWTEITAKFNWDNYHPDVGEISHPGFRDIQIIGIEKANMGLKTAYFWTVPEITMRNEWKLFLGLWCWKEICGTRKTAEARDSA